MVHHTAIMSSTLLFCLIHIVNISPGAGSPGAEIHREAEGWDIPSGSSKFGGEDSTLHPKCRTTALDGKMETKTRNSLLVSTSPVALLSLLFSLLRSQDLLPGPADNEHDEEL